MKNRVKPTKKQRSTFEHIKRGMALKDAMLAAGYTEAVANSPKQNFLDAAGVKPLIQQYRELLIKNGLSLDLMSELQIEGMFDENAAVRLQYIKETKKDLGMIQDVIGVETDTGKGTVRVIISRGE